MTTNKQLRELASKATAGPWWIDSHGHRMSANGGSDTVFIADVRMGPAARHPETGNLSHWPNDWDASYISAANPERVLALLDEIESLQAECAQLRAALVVELPERIEKETGYSEDDEYYNLAIDRCKQAIEAAGVRVKP